MIAIDKAIAIEFEAPELHVHRSIVLDSLDRRAEALVAVHEAHLKMKSDAQLMGALSDRLAKHDDLWPRAR